MTGGRQVPRGRERLPASRRAGGRPGRPADSLIAPGGRVPAAGYGEHVYDRWPVSGTNAHTILEEAPAEEPAEDGPA
ncbi:hypothetical protein ABT329_31670, partial [Streptomyces minutiscleroticus]